jgi:LCP family protein required for cell wall assembly
VKDLRASLEFLAGRGQAKGARAVVDRALAATTVGQDAGSVPSMAAPPAEAAARTRHWPRRLLIGVNILLAVCIVGVGAGYGYLRYRFGQIDKISIPIIGKVSGGQGAIHEDVPGEPMNVLLVGSDSRADLTGADCKRNCRDENGHLVTGQRSDTIMVLHVDPQQEKAAILSIPRDLWVTIAGTTRHNRINSSFDGKTPAEGAARLIQTIEQNLHIEINHFVQIDFVGFRNMVNAVDGVKIWVPSPARDFYSDLRIPSPGCISLTGDPALAWVRSRRYQ